MFIVKTEDNGYDEIETIGETEELVTTLRYGCGCEAEVTDSDGNCYDLKVYLERRT
jgi:hypothetical protein